MAVYPSHCLAVILGEISDTVTTEGEFFELGNFQIGADHFDFDAEYDDVSGRLDRIHEAGVFWPRFRYFGTVSQEECACPHPHREKPWVSRGHPGFIHSPDDSAN